MRIAAIIAFALCGTLNASLSDDFMADPMLESVAEPTRPRNIHVLLDQGASEALLEVKGPYQMYNPYDGSKIAAGLLGKRFMVHALDNGLKWGEEFPGIYQFYIAPRSDESSIFVNGVQYSGAIAVYAVGKTINIVNDLDIETYVKALLSPQFSYPLENEVMSALSILVRTNAYFAVSRYPDAYWHASARETGYQGSALIVPNSSLTKAVDSTRHLILVHPSHGKALPFASPWTEHCAGKTAAYHAMFRKDAFAPSHGVAAPHAALDRKECKWSYSLSKKALAQQLDLSQVKSVELYVDNDSGKVYGLRVKDGVETHDFDFFALQEKLGLKHIQSSDFTVALKDDAVVFEGYGKGHGVGLCLFSASAMAQNGDNAVKILSKFFPDTFLLNLNALPGQEEKSSH